jgi:hypothetical protein
VELHKALLEVQVFLDRKLLLVADMAEIQAQVL